MILNRITEPEELAVTAYLIAVSPQLQRSVKEQRVETLATAKARDAAGSLAAAASPPAVDLARARAVYQSKCVLCHSLQIVAAAPPRSETAVRDLVTRMVGMQRHKSWI